jgi:hypothetical protein
MVRRAALKKVTWQPSVEGFVTSHCGRWSIVPLYCGATRPQAYELRLDGETVDGNCATQREAKEGASWRPKSSSSP